MKVLRLRRLLTVLAVFVSPFTPGLHASDPRPTAAQWSVGNLPKKAVAPGTVFTLALTANLEPGWHLYALEEPEGGPLPTQIGLAQGDPLTLLDVNEPDPLRLPDPLTHAPVGLFQHSVSFTLKLRAPTGKPPAAATTHILVRYQACNDQVCLAPRTETIALPLHGIVN